MVSIRSTRTSLATLLTCLATLTCGLTTPPPAASAQDIAALSSTDALGRPTPAILAAATQLAATLPPPLREKLLAAVAFYTGDGAGLVPENGPAIAQFLWPTAARGCIGGQGDSVASAVAIPGPADLPLPGVEPQHTAFIVTALGTPAAKSSTMLVRWANLTTGATGVTPLSPTGINPTGPATVNGTAAIGSGHIVALVDGSVNGCYFPPTVASFPVP
ncbi:MAG: hypothetical protein SPI77_03030 [Corynebacterium sp.]|nr:hypothetical protein [Corynebacterium sp.]